MATEQAPALRPLAGLQPADEPDELRAVIRANASAMAEHEAGTRTGDDAEDLHRFRVATRRIRSLLRSTRPLVDDRDESEHLRADLKWLASLLGEVRDRDVLIEYLLGESETLDGAPLGAIVELLDGERQAARGDLVAALDSARYARLRTALAAPPALRRDDTLHDAARAEYKRVRKTMERLGKDPADEELHRGRIRVKRARYAAEAAGVGSRFVDRAKKLQDVLGEHQDAAVAEARIRELLDRVHGTGRTAFAAGRLVERQRARRAGARDDWPRAWRQLRKAGDKAF